MTLILHSKPWITDADLSAVKHLLISGMIGQGKKTLEFEYVLSNWVGVEESGIAVGSGSAAIVLALLAFGIGVRDEVILPTYLCPSVLEAVLTTRAKPVLCDVSSNWVVTAKNMADCITRKTKALIVPHMYGIFADIKSFRQFDIPIIEDCAQAIAYKSTNKINGDIATFSFHPTKCLTTGEGGMTISANPELVARMRSLRDGSKKADSSRLFSPMSDISASLGLSQLSRYDEALNRRRELGLKYKCALSNVIPDSLQYTTLKESIFFRFPLVVPGGLDLYQDLFLKRKICVRRGVDRLLHRLMKLPDDKFKTAVALYNTTVSLPIYPALSNTEHSYCMDSAVSIFSKHYASSIIFQK
jgi:UDP-4-amino-4-deoxy-L-arabinose-oxoglutarate aminotransferase